VRYAAAAINDETKWAAATLATAAWAANSVAGGGAASLDIPYATLGAGAKYFAVRYKDAADNVGAISNSPSVTLYAAAILRQTLYAATASTPTRTRTEFCPFTEDYSQQSAVQTHNGDPANYDALRAFGDAGEELVGNGTLRIEWPLTALTYAGTISEIVLVGKALADLGDGSGSTQPSINGATRGAAHTLTASEAQYSDNFTTDPADSVAWTAAKLAAQRMGYILTGNSGSPYSSTECRQTEFEVQVYG
jgi:hypothetical protein